MTTDTPLDVQSTGFCVNSIQFVKKLRSALIGRLQKVGVGVGVCDPFIRVSASPLAAHSWLLEVRVDQSPEIS